MANQKIHEYPIERFVYGDDDYYDVDFWDGLIYQTAKIKGSVIKSAMLSGIAISLTAPSAFIVGGSPTDGNGTLTLTAAGTANQYVRGDGTLATFPTSGGGGNSVNYYLNGGTAASVGTYFQMSKTPVLGTSVDFSLAGNGLISQWLTDIGDPNVVEIPAGNWNFEMYFSASSSGGTPAFYVEVLKYDGTTFTSIANNSANPEGITNGTATDLYVCAVPMPLTTLLPTDRIALRVYIVNSILGRTITHHTQDSNLSQVITTFSSGISSINGLTKQTQYLAVGTDGTDFNIDSTTDTHTFHLPTASATKRGALSTTDWTTFNGKQENLVSGTNIKTINGTSLLGSGDITVGGGITVGTTAVTSGTDTRIFFQQGGVVQQDANFTFNNTQKRLTLRAVGTASTDIPLVIRNSADTADLFTLSGNNQFSLGNSVASDGFTTYLGTPSGVTQITASGNGLTLTSNFSATLNATNNTAIQTNGTTRIYCNNAGNVGIGSATTLGARLDVRAQGALSTDIAFRVRNSADTDNLAYVSGNGLAIIGINASSSPTLIIDPSGSARATLRGGTNQSILLNSSGFNNLNGGSGGWDIEATGGQIRQRNGSNYTLLSGNFFGIGRTPSARLDVQAQGATVTDLALRVRNSADTNNLFLVKGNGVLNAPNLPTSPAGLVTGDIWNNLGILTIV